MARFRLTYSPRRTKILAGLTSWGEAMKAGGSAVADAWMEVAADVDDTILLRAVDDYPLSFGTSSFQSRSIRPVRSRQGHRA